MDKMEETRLNAMFQALQQQRDAAQVQVGQMAGEIAVLKMQIEELQKPKEVEVVPTQD